MLFCFTYPATTEIYTLSLHDALPISHLEQDSGEQNGAGGGGFDVGVGQPGVDGRSEEHTSELQSRQYLVCRLLLEKKKSKRFVRRVRELAQAKARPGSPRDADVGRPG